jgi:hypothetical protein
VRTEKYIAAAFSGLGFGAMGIGVVMAILNLFGANVPAGFELMAGGVLLIVLASCLVRRPRRKSGV